MNQGHIYHGVVDRHHARHECCLWYVRLVSGLGEFRKVDKHDKLDFVLSTQVSGLLWNHKMTESKSLTTGTSRLRSEGQVQ